MGIKYLESGKHYEGRIYHSRNYGDFEILGEVIYIKEHVKTAATRWFHIRFLNTGYIMVAELHAIINGRVRDRLVPEVAGVGYIGSEITVTSEEYKYRYRSWNDMINRCYNPKNHSYYDYGALGVSVDPRWFNFTVFADDVTKIPGYDMKLQYPTLYELDKDYLQQNVPKAQRIYSKDTCVWLSGSDNKMLMGIANHPSKSNYIGVQYKDGSWATFIGGVTYGRFTTPEAAANLYNYIVDKVRPEHYNITMRNNVPVIPYNELKNYAINKQRWLNDYPEME